MSGKATCDADHINLNETRERKKNSFNELSFILFLMLISSYVFLVTGLKPLIYSRIF